MLSLKSIARSAVNRIFLFSDRLGFHLLPKHFYTPIPDYKWLRENLELWAKPAPMTGIVWQPERQLAWLKAICEPFYSEVHGQFDVGGFGPIEAHVLHCFIRSEAPQRIVEIGGGNSTGIMLQAIDRNLASGRNGRPHLTSIEPYPKRYFRSLINANEGLFHVPMLCQAVQHEVFAALSAGDFLSIDSSHTVKTGSDVLRIYLDIIPRLPPGVFIHIHDIYLPYLYPPDALTTFTGWQETSLVLALLTNNPRLEILACMSALHYSHREQMKQILTDYAPREYHYGFRIGESHFPSSLWLLTQ